MEIAETAWALAGNPRVGNGKLSVQQVLSCVEGEDKGCVGGFIRDALMYMYHQHGAASGVEENVKFPFQCVKGCSTMPACPSAIAKPFGSINSTCRCSFWDEESMRVHVANVSGGRVACAIARWMAPHHSSGQPCLLRHSHSTCRHSMVRSRSRSTLTPGTDTAVRWRIYAASIVVQPGPWPT